MTPSGQTLCLCMIVKNEAPVIRRCLDSARPIIDYWVIIDTGSTDGTQDIVRAALHDLPGALVERPWRDFAFNRTESLALARPNGDYSLIIDADDVLVIPEHFHMPDLDADSYSIDIDFNGVRYLRPQIVKATLPWRYEGVLHEYLACDGARTSGHLPLVLRINHDGARRRDPQTYRKDAELLESALTTEVNPFLRARYTFYLAQSYRDCGETQKAIMAYHNRAAMGYWSEEIFVSLYQAARLMEAQGDDSEDVLSTYQRASDICPSRAEALHGASRLCRKLGYNERGHAIAKLAIDLSAPSDGLFVEQWIYDYGALDEFVINAYWAGYYHDCLDASLRALASGKIPPAEQSRFVQNAQFALGLLPKEQASAPPKPPSAPSLPVIGVRDLQARLPDPAPRILVAILAKQKEPVLRLYLACLEALDYPKSSIVLYIKTNNNNDRTRDILQEWVQRVSADYAHVDFDDTDVAEQVQSFGVHEWNATRFKVLAAIRNTSLRKTIEHACAFYFVVDVDNFIAAQTLRELVALNLPIVAPLLRHVDPTSRYSNFHADIDRNGYFVDSPRYDQILWRELVGLFEVPVVHCTYLIRADVLSHLNYEDGSGRYEYVIFSDKARSHGIPQYFDNRQVYGLLTLNDDAPELIFGQLETIEQALGRERAVAKP
jgi:glycosyltransferase involved in cell wall biosynthesis